MMYYCKYCGHISFLRISLCPKCQMKDSFVTANRDMEYYEAQSISIKGNRSIAEKLFIQSEVMKNPEYNPEYANGRLVQNSTPVLQVEKQTSSADMADVILRAKAQQKSANANVPKCPTCGSTNIQKISDLRRGAHAVAWGLLSKTARSQFECKNCGYKW